MPEKTWVTLRKSDGAFRFCFIQLSSDVPVPLDELSHLSVPTLPLVLHKISTVTGIIRIFNSPSDVTNKNGLHLQIIDSI